MRWLRHIRRHLLGQRWCDFLGGRVSSGGDTWEQDVLVILAVLCSRSPEGVVRISPAEYGAARTVLLQYDILRSFDSESLDRTLRYRLIPKPHHALRGEQVST